MENKNCNFNNISVRKLLLQLSIPSIIALMFHSLSFIINGMYLCNFAGIEALAGITLCYPVFVVLFSFVLLLSVGSGIILSNAYGEGKHYKEKKI